MMVSSLRVDSSECDRGYPIPAAIRSKGKRHASAARSRCSPDGSVSRGQGEECERVTRASRLGDDVVVNRGTQSRRNTPHRWRNFGAHCGTSDATSYGQRSRRAGENRIALWPTGRKSTVGTRERTGRNDYEVAAPHPLWRVTSMCEASLRCAIGHGPSAASVGIFLSSGLFPKTSARLTRADLEARFIKRHYSPPAPWRTYCSSWWQRGRPGRLCR